MKKCGKIIHFNTIYPFNYSENNENKGKLLT